MARIALAIITVGSLVVAGLPACSSGGGSSGPSTCPGGVDAGPASASVASSTVHGQCSSAGWGNKQDGESCQSSYDCTPTCCACPNNSITSSVGWCDQGKCVGGATVCCAWLQNPSSAQTGPVECEM